MCKIQSVMRRDIGRVALDTVDLLDELLFGRFPRRDSEQKTDHQAYLGTQKTVSLKYEDKVSFVRVSIGTIDDTGVVFQIVAAFFEEFKIMGSDKTADRIGNRFTVEMGDKRDEVVFEGIDFVFFDDVAVYTALGAVTGMKIVVRKFDPLYPHSVRELDIEHLFEPLQVAPKLGNIDMDNLMSGVNPSIGTAGGFWGGGDFEAMEDGNEMPHDRVIGVGLLLGTHKRRAVVAQGYFDTAQKRLPTRRL